MGHPVFLRFPVSLAYLGKITFLALFITGCVATLTPPASPTPQPSLPPPSPTPVAEVAVAVWLTTADQSHTLEPQPSVIFGEAATGDSTIYINENHAYQQMDGFGASMTDSSAWLIYTQLSEAQRQAVMAALFSPTDGIGVSVTRIPMGASDFVQGEPYTYDDLPPGQTDPDLAHFSIEHDQAYIIPALQEALKINPRLKIMASPWSPPAWMKSSASLMNGTLQKQYYPALAQYFVKFIQAYQAEQLPIYAVTLQNEPHHEPNTYPGMRLEPAEAAEFVAQHLKPAFVAAGLETKILIWDHNWDEWDYPLAVLNDPQAKAGLDGVAFHCYGGTVLAQSIVHDAHPDKDIYFTECSGGTWIANEAVGLQRDMKDLVIGASRHWAKTVIKWNLALDTQHNPHHGGCATCAGLITIDPTSASGFTANFDYYAIGHASKFIVPGADRIASTTFYNGLESVAFKNPDGSKVLIVANTSGSADKTFVVRWGTKALTYTLPQGAVATFTWAGEQEISAPPSAPVGLVSKRSPAHVVLKWDFSPQALTYTIKRSTQAGGPYTVIADGIGVPEYFDSTVAPELAYYYVVSARNEWGESAEANEATALP